MSLRVAEVPAINSKGRYAMKIHINDGCIGCGLCETTCPDVFRMGDGGLAEVYAGATNENTDSVETAAELCPVAVIVVEE